MVVLYQRFSWRLERWDKGTINKAKKGEAMIGTYYFSYRRKGAFAPVRFGCYSREQAFYLANQKWQEGHHDKYTMFQVEYVECGDWETVRDFLKEEA